MKHLIFIVILIVAVLVAGCTTAAPSSGTTTATGIPDLTGNWTGSMTSFVNGTGYVTYPESSMTMTVSNQTGRIFSGTMFFTQNPGTVETQTFAGVIGRDGRTITLVNEGGGYDVDSTLISENEIELVYVKGAPPYIISLDSLKRV
jgi:hypothetical protein